MFCIVALTGGNDLPSLPMCVFQLSSPFFKRKAWTLDVCVNVSVLMVLSGVEGVWTDRARLEVHKRGFLGKFILFHGRMPKQTAWLFLSRGKPA